MRKLPITTRYFGLRWTLPEDITDSLQVASSVNDIGLQVTSLGPLIPCVDIEYLRLAFSCIKECFDSEQRRFERRDSIATQGWHKRIPDIKVAIGLDSPRACIPAHRNIWKVRHAIRAACRLPIGDRLVKHPVVICDWEVWQSDMMNPDVGADAIESKERHYIRWIRDRSFIGQDLDAPDDRVYVHVGEARAPCSLAKA